MRAAPRPLAGETLLAAWEGATQVPEPRRPLSLLAAATPDEDATALSAIALSERNLRLVRLHEVSFGPDLAVFGSCPDCGERLEFTLPSGEVAGQFEAAAAAGPVEWTEDGQAYRLRPVTTDDLVAALVTGDQSQAQDILLARCVEPAGGSTEAAKRFEEMHADTEIRCALTCPGCAGQHVLDLDIGRFLWREVEVAARRLLAEVHTLAAAYGWAERDIVRLSPRRRAAYLELVNG
jgi:hypothetical protein